MKTTKIWMLAAILTLCGTTINAQQYNTKHDLSLGWGIGTNSDIINVFEDAISTDAFATLGSKYQLDNEESIGTFSLEYTYHLSKLIGVGAVAAFGAREHDLFIDGKAQGKMSNYYLTFMPALKFDWLRKSHFGMYSKLAAGITYRMEKDSDIDYSESECHFNWQASLLGVEAGGSKVRGFTEFGMGEQGIILAGVRFKF